MRVRLLSRGSALAVLQAQLVARELARAWPSLDVVPMTRSSEGDRDRRVALWAMPDKGLFTTDLSHALVAGETDLVVHSWKDLPIESYPGTVVAGTLERADPRDVLLISRDVVAARPPALAILSSSPRRSWQLETSLAPLLPWPVSTVQTKAIRGNIPTRLQKLLAGEGDALVVAKAALDRLLSSDAPDATRDAVRRAIDRCRWMVLPLRECPTAPAQGALAIEIAANRDDLRESVGAITHEATSRAVARERQILADMGGGCHEAVGATVLVRDYGVVTSVRARMNGAGDREAWSLDAVASAPPKTSIQAIWPRPDERDRAKRRPLDPPPAIDAGDLWVARADALPDAWHPSADQLIWVSGGRTWRRLASRGAWVNGSADGLGDLEAPNVDAVANRRVTWRRLTHTGSTAPDAVATYVVRRELPDDLPSRTHFFWTSGSLFLEAMRRHPALDAAWHASGPGRTARTIRDMLGADSRTSVWLDYDQWLTHLTS